MVEDRLQTQRMELKYQVTEGQAERIREYIRSYLELDDHGVRQPNGSYPVHSLYLDSDDLKLYWETINGTKNRFKLRLRFYEQRPEAPVYFEIKRRMNNCILKQRGGVRRDAVDWLLAGHLPEPRHLTSEAPQNLVALHAFCQRMISLRARPQAHIAYLREAWVSPENNAVRVTLDRQVQCEPEHSAPLDIALRQPELVFGATVILELKFTLRGRPQSLWQDDEDVMLEMNGHQSTPGWFGEFIRTFGLVQTGAAKYVDGVAMLGEDRFREPSEPWETAVAAET